MIDSILETKNVVSNTPIKGSVPGETGGELADVNKIGEIVFPRIYNIN